MLIEKMEDHDCDCVLPAAGDLAPAVSLTGIGTRL
jgi:hypothetical protein